MRWLLALAAACSLSASVAFSEPAVCSDCFLGVYDDLAMTQSSGRAASFQVKSVYLGLRLAPGVGTSRIDFDATYPPGFTVVDVQALVPGATYDTVGNRAQVRWNSCVTGTHALFRVKVLTTATPRNALLQLRNGVAGACPGPAADGWLVPTGCYMLNPGGTAPPCSTPVAPSTWTFVKALFGTTGSR